MLMKNKLFLWLIAVVCILASCSKDDGIDPVTDSSDALLKGKPVHGPVVVLPPSGGDDTDAFMNAINTALPGTVIKLQAGNYSVGLMEIYDFHGSIVGAGRDKTVINTKTPLPLLSQWAKNQTPGWWRLIAGEIVITDLTFKMPDGFISDELDPYNGPDLYAMFMINHYNDTYYDPYGDPQKVLFRNVGFIGGTNTDMSQDTYWVTDNNVWLGIWIGVDYTWPAEGLDYPLTRGSYVITNCYFENMLQAAEGFSLGDEACMEVSDSKIDNTWMGMYFTANYNSKIEITRNVFNNSILYDINIEDNDWDWLFQTAIEPLQRCQYNITGNIFNYTSHENIYGYNNSVILKDNWVAIDPEARLPMLINLKSNQFNLSGTGTGVLANNSQDLVIRNNRLTGTCYAGVVVDGIPIYDMSGTEYPAPFAKNALILGNNFNGLYPSEANIILGEKTMDCTVVGSGKESVIDLGTNNKIVGMKKMHGGNHAGPTIRDNYRMMPRPGHHPHH